MKFSDIFKRNQKEEFKSLTLAQASEITRQGPEAIKKYLGSTLLNDDWKNKHLQNKTVSKIQSSFSFINGENEPNKKVLLSNLLRMQSVGIEAINLCKSNFNLRNKLCAKIKSSSDPVNMAIKLWNENSTELNVSIVDVWKKAGGKEILGTVKSAKNSTWPVKMFNESRRLEFIGVAGGKAPSDCFFHGLDPVGVNEYVNLIYKLISLADNCRRTAASNELPLLHELGVRNDGFREFKLINTRLAWDYEDNQCQPLYGVAFLSETFISELLTGI